MKHEFDVSLTWDNETEVYVVTVPALPGCFTQGKDRDEAMERIQEAITGHIENLNLTVVRETGNHRHIHRAGNNPVTVPVNKGEAVSPMLIDSILEQSGLTLDELVDCYKAKSDKEKI